MSVSVFEGTLWYKTTSGDLVPVGTPIEPVGNFLVTESDDIFTTEADDPFVLED